MLDLPTESDPVRVVEGDNLAALPALPADAFDSVVTDPPYALTEPRAVDGFGSMQRRGGFRTEDEKARRRGGFMGKAWDSELPGVEHWQAVLRVLKPGGYMLCFGGTRTYHRLACAVEDAGFEIRDCLMWVYGTGFPKGQGCLKPAWEPILLARKPGPRVLPLQIDRCRVGAEVETWPKSRGYSRHDTGNALKVSAQPTGAAPAGRYPANVLHDGSDEVLEAFAAFGEKVNAPRGPNRGPMGYQGAEGYHDPEGVRGFNDTGTAARFFYCSKASKKERVGSKHPTIKPLSLMRWLVRLVTPAGGLTLDPFAGSGATVEAALLEGFRAVAIEREAEYCADIRKRVERVRRGAGLFAETA